VNVNYSIVRQTGEPVLFGYNLDAAHLTVVRASIFASQHIEFPGLSESGKQVGGFWQILDCVTRFGGSTVNLNASAFYYVTRFNC
jgi:hypothetical protein